MAQNLFLHHFSKIKKIKIRQIEALQNAPSPHLNKQYFKSKCNNHKSLTISTKIKSKTVSFYTMGNQSTKVLMGVDFIDFDIF